jgi:hypothetical protein
MFKKQNHSQNQQFRNYGVEFFWFCVKLQLWVWVISFFVGLILEVSKEFNSPPEPSKIMLEEIKPTN